MTKLSGMINPLLQCALRMRKRLRRAPKLHLGANIIPALLTSFANPTWQPNLQCDFISNFETSLDFCSHRYNHARRLVAQRHGLEDLDVAIAEVVVVV